MSRDREQAELRNTIAWLKAGEPGHAEVALGKLTPGEALARAQDPDALVPALFKDGDTCPCKCGGTMVLEDAGGFDHVICPECGYCPEDAFDGRIDDCPSCGAFAHIINQGNIICSGCELELTAEDEETAIRAWNGIKPKLPDKGIQASLVNHLWQRRHQLTPEEWQEAAPVVLGYLVGLMSELAEAAARAGAQAPRDPFDLIAEGLWRVHVPEAQERAWVWGHDVSRAYADKYEQAARDLARVALRSPAEGNARELGQAWLDNEYTGKMNAATLHFSPAEMVDAFAAGFTHRGFCLPAVKS